MFWTGLVSGIVSGLNNTTGGGGETPPSQNQQGNLWSNLGKMLGGIFKGKDSVTLEGKGYTEPMGAIESFLTFKQTQNGMFVLDANGNTQTSYPKVIMGVIPVLTLLFWKKVKRWFR